jgi:hypothetical protein
MFRFTHRARLLLACLLLFFCAKTWAADEFIAPSGSEKYQRFTLAAAGGDAKMETAVRTFRSTTDPAVHVDLVSVIHVGQQAYYEQIDKLLDDYDVVLYEYVAPVKGGKPGKSVYPKLAKALGLESQTKYINYERGHFVHADMTVAELREAFRKRGVPYEEPHEEMAAKVLTWLGPTKARWALTVGMLVLDRQKPRPSDAVIIRDRNQVALEVLAETLAKGHKKIAIFYGVGHMPDFERELTGRFNMVGADERWLTAWTVPMQKTGIPSQLAPKLRASAASLSPVARLLQTTIGDLAKVMQHFAGLDGSRGVAPMWPVTMKSVGEEWRGFPKLIAQANRS